MNEIESGTIGGMVAYLDDLIDKNRAEASKITPLKSAVKRVFSSVDGYGWMNGRVEEVDVDDVIKLFKHYCGAEFNEDTFAAYRARINRALKWYKSYLEDHEWSPFKKTSALEELLGSYINSKKIADYSGADKVTQQVSEMVEYPFPLSGGLMANLRLPKSLTREDAERLKKFIEALVVEEGDE